MSSASKAANQPWRDAWFDTIKTASTQAWRGVEAQHVVSTMRLVDTLAEQAVLEQLLEQSKPAVGTDDAPKHYLLFTPFRYRSPHASRFRQAHDAGVWYGAKTVQTAVAELAYWRWRFLTDSDGLKDQTLLTQHTLFRAAIKGRAIHLQKAPWVASHDAWAHHSDYSATQALARAAAPRGVQWLSYASARDVHGACVAVFDLAAMQSVDLTSQQTWHCVTTAQSVRFAHDGDGLQFDAAYLKC
jgi:RES domain